MRMMSSQNRRQASSSELTMADFDQIVEEELGVAKGRSDKEFKLAKERADKEFNLAKERSDKEFNLAKERSDKEFNLAKERSDKEFDLAKDRILTRISGIINDGNQSSASKNMKLEFINRISKTILTGDVIEGQGHTCMKVALYDDTTGNVIDVGSQACAGVEIVVLKEEFDSSRREDDWTAEEFDQNTIRETQAKKPLLGGNVRLKLKRGVAALENIKFRHHTSKMKPSVFRLGARVVERFEGIRIKEAKTEAFAVKDFRNKYFQKHETPAWSDDVYRLDNIRKGGKIHKRLQDIKIHTVEDFLIRLLIDPERLKSFEEICNFSAKQFQKNWLSSFWSLVIGLRLIGDRVVKLGPMKWEAILKHARECPSDKRIYCYINFQRKTGIVFNLCGFQGLYRESQYVLINTLAENHKAEEQDLVASACEHWEDIVRFDDEASLHRYVTTSLLQVNSPRLNCLPCAYENVVTSDMIGESSNSPFVFPTHVDDVMETLYDTPMQFSPPPQFDPDTFFSLTPENFFTNLDESYPDEQMSADPMVVKRWELLVRVLRWCFSVKRICASMKGNHHRPKKMQKVL